MIDLAELGRRAGSMLEVAERVPAPAHVTGEVARIAEGSALDLDIRLESVVDGVLVSGTVAGTATAECVRCLDPVEQPVAADLQELYAYPGHEDENTSLVHDDTIDLEPVVHDALVLALPLVPVCAPDCLGLCSVCGARLADDPGHGHQEIDPRWAALAGLNAAATTASDERADL